MRPLAALRIYYLVSFASMGVVFPFLPVWLEGRGITGFELGLLTALRPVAGIVAPPLFGLLADWLGLRRSLLRVGSAGATLAMAGLAAWCVFGAPPALAVFALLAAFFFLRVPMTLLADVAAVESGADYGRQRLWGSLGFLLAAIAAGSFIELGAAAPMPVLVTALLLLATGFTLLMPGASGGPPRPVWGAAAELLSTPDFRVFLAGAFLWGMAHSAYDLLLSLHLRDLGASSGFAGVAWAVGTIAEVALFVWSGSWLARHGATRLLLLGALLGALRWGLLAAIPSAPALMLLQPLHAASFALVFVAALAFVRQRAEPHVLATAQGVFSASTGLGATLGTLLCAPFYARTGGASVFLAAAVVALVGAAIWLPLVRAPQPAPAE